MDSTSSIDLYNIFNSFGKYLLTATAIMSSIESVEIIAIFVTLFLCWALEEILDRKCGFQAEVRHQQSIEMLATLETSKQASPVPSPILAAQLPIPLELQSVASETIERQQPKPRVQRSIEIIDEDNVSPPPALPPTQFRPPQLQIEFKASAQDHSTSDNPAPITFANTYSNTSNNNNNNNDNNNKNCSHLNIQHVQQANNKTIAITVPIQQAKENSTSPRSRSRSRSRAGSHYKTPSLHRKETIAMMKKLTHSMDKSGTYRMAGRGSVYFVKVISNLGMCKY